MLLKVLHTCASWPSNSASGSSMSPREMDLGLWWSARNRGWLDRAQLLHKAAQMRLDLAQRRDVGDDDEWGAKGWL